LSFVKKILNRLNSKYLTLCYKTIKLEKNAILDYRCEIESKTNISMGKKSILYKHVTIYKNREGKLEIGVKSHIAPYGYFLLASKKISIGDNVAIAKNCSFFCSTNSIPLDDVILYKDSYQEGDINIGNNVLIGANCVVLPNTVIEDDVVIGANSTIKGHLKKGCLYGGNPVKKIKKVFG